MAPSDGFAKLGTLSNIEHPFDAQSFIMAE